MNDITQLLNGLPGWSFALIITALIFLFLVLVKRIVFRSLLKVIESKQVYLLSEIVLSLKRPMTLILLSISFGIYESIQSRFDEQVVDTSYLHFGAKMLLILAIVLFIDRLLISILGHYVEKSTSLKSGKSIIQVLVRIIILGLGILVILGTLGISITPIVASLGITSLAVALALQPTLENFFSGVQLVMDKPIRVGDYIELDSGEQGFVEKIGWRTTWIKMLPNNIVIVPNSLLSSSKLINYYYPEKQLSVPVDVGVHYDSDLEHVERVTLEVAREILKTHKWGVPDYETFVVYHTFDNSSINFTVMLRAQEYFNRFFIKSEFIKALHKRYQQEGITIPYPIRAINYEQEKASID